MKTKAVVATTFDSKTADELDEAARSKNRSIADYVRDAVKQRLEQDRERKDSGKPTESK